MDSPIARTTDPQTSHQAAAQHTLGKRAIRQRQVLNLICRVPGQTSGELARAMHSAHPELPIAVAVESPHKRLADLEQKGLVEKGRTRPCRDSGYDRITWYPTLTGIMESDV
jgi:hypothetical protein